jgi:hypothetical protein
MMQRSTYSIHDVGNLGVHDHPLANARKTTEAGIGGWESLRHRDCRTNWLKQKVSKSMGFGWLRLVLFGFTYIFFFFSHAWRRRDLNFHGLPPNKSIDVRLSRWKEMRRDDSNII